MVGTVASGNSISFGSVYTFESNSCENVDITTLDSTHIVIAFEDVTDGEKGKAIVGTISSGNQVSFGSEYEFNAGTTNRLYIATVDSTHIAIAYEDKGNSSYGTAIIGELPAPVSDTGNMFLMFN